MNLNFLNNYWAQKRVFENRHFLSLNECIIKSVECNGIAEDKIKTMYKGHKRWDMHFPSKKIAIEYKTIATEQQQQFVLKVQKNVPFMNLKRNIGNRIEEAIGSAIDLKHLNPDYKLGYIMVFTMKRELNLQIPQKLIDGVVTKFDKMISNNLYNFFCPLMTFGIDDHQELSEKYSFSNFIEQIKNIPSVEYSPLSEFFV